MNVAQEGLPLMLNLSLDVAADEDTVGLKSYTAEAATIEVAGDPLIREVAALAGAGSVAMPNIATVTRYPVPAVPI